jgi:hypothetical protein
MDFNISKLVKEIKSVNVSDDEGKLIRKRTDVEAKEEIIETRTGYDAVKFICNDYNLIYNYFLDNTHKFPEGTTIVPVIHINGIPWNNIDYDESDNGVIKGLTYMKITYKYEFIITSQCENKTVGFEYEICNCLGDSNYTLKLKFEFNTKSRDGITNGIEELYED